MLYYGSIHPEWDCFGDFADTRAARQIAELLEAAALNHYRNAGQVFDRLERMGVMLGNGGFAAALLQQDPYGPADALEDLWPRQVVAAAKDCLTAPLWYCFSVSGRLYILCCFSRLREQEDRTAQVSAQLFADFSRLSEQLSEEHGRLLLSDLQFGEPGIFRCFNNLHHAMEYFDFCTAEHRLVQLDSERQLHGAFIGDMSLYRQFSVSVAEQLVRENCDVDAVAKQVCDTILEGSVPSMESVHHHIQIFMLTFTDYLGSSGLVDAAYIQRKRIVYRAMAFEREAELRSTMGELLEELRRQHQVLRAVGRQKRIQDLREYVEAHIDQPELSVSALSEKFGISTAQIAKQFRYYFGVSLHRFLQQTRFQRAQALIEAHPDWPMYRVAQAAGYTDQSTMYRAFRQFGNVTPGALRDTLRRSGEQ